MVESPQEHPLSPMLSHFLPLQGRIIPQACRLSSTKNVTLRSGYLYDISFFIIRLLRPLPDPPRCTLMNERRLLRRCNESILTKRRRLLPLAGCVLKSLDNPRSYLILF